MNCTQVRDALMQAGPAAGGAASGSRPEVTAHLRRCASCHGFAARIDSVRHGLREHHAGIQPDAGFAGRLQQRLGDDTPEVLGRTALRLLPLSAAVLLLLLWVSARTSPVAETPASLAATEDAYISWVLTPDEGNS